MREGPSNRLSGDGLKLRSLLLLPDVERVRSAAGFFKKDKYEALLAALPDYLLPVIAIGYTGMRRREIVTLKWTQVDLLRRVIRLNAGETKTAKGARFRLLKNLAVLHAQYVRGPEPFPLKLNLIPRATGEAADIVVTEYDIPDKDGRTIGRLDPKTGYITQYRLTGDGSTVRNDEPEYDNNEFRDGSDWSTGLRSRLQVYSQHDLVVGKDGYVYFPPAIGVGLDPEGNVWCSFGNEMAAKFDVKTQKIASFPLPKGWATFNNGKDVDSKGNFWAAQPNGTYRLDPKTGQYTEFKAKTQLGRPYGLTIDSEDNVWIAQIAVDKVGYVDGNTGEVGEVVLPPIDDEDISAADRELGRGWDLGQPLYAKGPRRLRADRKGDTVWVSEYFAGRLAKIDIHTKKLTEYKLPALYRYANVYEPVVDKNHMVWFSMTNQDALGRFNPVTEKFTFYPNTYTRN